jgi:hypothetical protein
MDGILSFYHRVKVNNKKDNVTTQWQERVKFIVKFKAAKCKGGGEN